MPERIDANIAVRDRTVDSGGAEPAESEGSYRGETVKMAGDPLSLLRDAAEELTFAHSERVEEQDIAERKVEARTIGLPPPSQIEELFDKLPDTGGAKRLQELIDKIRQGGAQTPQQLLELIRQSYEDVSHQFLALQELQRRLGEAKDAPELQEAAGAALAELEAAHGPAIRAGINAAQAIADFAQGDAVRARELRQFYRDSVLDFDKIADTYQAVLAKFGVDDFPRAVTFLIKAAGDDLAAKGPSTPGPALKHILDELYQLEVLATVHDRCSKLFQSMSHLFELTPGGSPQALTGELMGLTGDRLVNADRVGRLVDGLGVGEGEPRISFLRELKEIVRLVPLKVYQEPDQRELLRDAVQGALDTAIENEA